MLLIILVCSAASVSGWRVGLLASPDAMPNIAACRARTGQDSAIEQFMDKERSFRQYVGAWDDDESFVGFAHLGRLAVGGFLVLSKDYQLTSVAVGQQLKGVHLEAALIDELLHRLPAVGCSAWALCNDDVDAELYAECGGELVGDLAAVRQANQVVAAALCLSGGALLRTQDLRVYRWAGRGDAREYTIDGRLSRGVV